MLRRSTPTQTAEVEIARLILRLSLGTTMIAHGVRHGRTIDGTARWFDSIGFRQPKLQAQVSAAVEIGSGAALAAGLATPLSASAVIGTMVVAARTVHVQNGFFITKEGYEYVATIAAASAALAALGGGRYSVDGMTGLFARLNGGRGAALATVLGVAGAAGQLATFWRDPKRRRA